jgi:hypothetical protein
MIVFAFSVLEFHFPTESSFTSWSYAADTIPAFEISSRLGTVTDRYEGPSHQTIFILQDLHCVPDAQRNIAQITRILNRRFGIRLAGLEGASGRVDPGFLGMLPDAKSRDATLARLLVEGSLTGVEWMTAKDSLALELWGIENRTLYEEHLDAFLESRSSMKQALRILDLFQNQLQERKRKALSKSLRDLDKSYWYYRSGKISLSRLLKMLKDEAGIIGLELSPEIKKYIDFFQFSDRMDLEMYERDISSLSEEISRHASKAQISGFVRLILKFRLSKISEVAFLDEIIGWIAKLNLKSEEYPQLQMRRAIFEKRQTLNAARLHDQLKDMIRKLIGRGLYQDTEFYSHLNDLLNLKLSPEDWIVLKKRLKKRPISPWFNKDGVNLSKNQLESLRMNIKRAVEFYRLAQKRDDALVQGMLMRMESRGESRALLIAGGFHTAGMTRELRKRGISYCIILPKVDQ